MRPQQRLYSSALPPAAAKVGMLSLTSTAAQPSAPGFASLPFRQKAAKCTAHLRRCESLHGAARDAARASWAVREQGGQAGARKGGRRQVAPGCADADGHQECLHAAHATSHPAGCRKLLVSEYEKTPLAPSRSGAGLGLQSIDDLSRLLADMPQAAIACARRTKLRLAPCRSS